MSERIRASKNKRILGRKRELVPPALLPFMVILLAKAFFPAQAKNLSTGAPGIVIQDSLRRRVAIPERGERIISLQPEITRIIVALGGGGHLVGIDRFLRHEDHLFPLIFPRQAELPLIALNEERANAELVLQFQPDIVFVSPSEPSLVEALTRKLSLPVVALSSLGKFDLLLKEIELVGRAVGREERARELGVYFQSKLKELEKIRHSQVNRPKPRVYLAFWSSLVMTPVAYDPVNAAGGINLAEGLIPSYLGTARTVISLERLLQWDPDFILIHGNYRPGERKVTVEGVLQDRRLVSLSAIKKRQVFYTFGFWYWWDPAEALFESFYLACLFYPEIRPQLDLKVLGQEIFEKFYGQPEAFSLWLKVLQIELP